MSGNPICSECGKRMGVGYNFKKEIHNQLPIELRSKVLCIECYLVELEKAAPKQKIGLNSLTFLSLRGDFDNPEFGGPLMMNDRGKDRRIYLGD